MRRSLVSCAELNENPHWRVFDCRHQLADAGWGERAFAQGHLPGAVHVHLDQVLAGKPDGRNGRHPLPEPGLFARWLGTQGLRPGDQVVAYDDAGGSMAARLWWMLRWMGHDAAAVLDGGLPAWAAQGLPLEREVRIFQPTTYPCVVRSGMTVDAADLVANLPAHKLVVVDARGLSRYAGEQEPIDRVPGHIPGAINRPYTDNLDAGGCFKSARQLRDEFDALLGGLDAVSIVSQCGSGVTACHQLLAMEIAGLTGGRLYPGSWSEWCSDPARPIATGRQP